MPFAFFFPPKIVPGVFFFTATRWASVKVRILFTELKNLTLSQKIVHAGLLSASGEKRSGECSNVSGRGECDIPGRGVSFRSLHSPEEEKKCCGDMDKFYFWRPAPKHSSLELQRPGCQEWISACFGFIWQMTVLANENCVVGLI